MDVPLKVLVENIMKGTVIDVFYLIREKEHIHKSEILQKFVEYDDDPACKTTKYRLPMDIAIAKLEGANLVSSYQDGRAERYVLTDYGRSAETLLSQLLDENPAVLHGSKIITKLGA
ncbi:hypothetical protein MKZ21_30915 [Paenibacillus sp. FSL P2-0536]|uniref:hypothetical protein n=1 Tax=Paenibacillus sp. FSL P2-0536 TaxID=2921629 RepID=UPI0030FCFE95